MTTAEATPAVAVVLLGRADAPRRQLRQALDELGAAVIHEGDLHGADCNELVALRPSVVLVNLGPGAEDALDELDALFDAPGVNVVFNDAEISGSLSGWDLARWARHLAAKVLGHHDTVPPPPPGAALLERSQYVPEPGAPRTPEQEVGSVAIESFAEEAAGSEAAVPSSPRLDQVEAPAVETAQDDAGAEAEIDDDAVFEDEQPEDEIIQLEGDSIVVDRVLGGNAPEIEIDEIEVSSLDGLHDAESTVSEDIQLPGVSLVTELHGGEQQGDDFSIDLGAIEDSLAQLETVDDGYTPRAEAAADGSDFSGLDLGIDLDFDTAPPRSFATQDDIGDVDLGLDDDVAALEAQLDSLQPTHSTDAVVDLAFDTDEPDAGPAPQAEAPAASRVAPAAPIAPPSARTVPTDLGHLSLSPMDDDALSAPQPAAAAKVASKTYDFSGLSLSLEPEDDSAGAPPASSAVTMQLPAVPRTQFADSGLSLEAIEDDATVEAAPAAPAAAAVVASVARPEPAPAAPSADAAELVLEDEDEEADTEIRRVIVLAASIGGPDALRSFLASLPAGFPALLLLCQHLDNGFFTRLAQQLQKVSKLPVRVADDGAGPARPGQVLIVPSNARYRFDEDGRIDAQPHAEPPRYQPCIDDLMRDVADRFGRRVTAIIFSGMAGDAVEGAVHVTVRGGEVWAQHPESCVVSSMVDGARARGVVEFVGSPRELAEQCVRRFDRRVTDE